MDFKAAALKNIIQVFPQEAMATEDEYGFFHFENMGPCRIYQPAFTAAITCSMSASERPKCMGRETCSSLKIA